MPKEIPPQLSEKIPQQNSQRLIQIIGKYKNKGQDSNILFALEQIAGIEAQILTHKELANFVSCPGTMTHVTSDRQRENGEIPLHFWLRQAYGEKKQFFHSIEDETTFSYNLTLFDNYNPSIEAEHCWWTLKNCGRKTDDNLVIFSQSAVRKVASEDFFVSLNPNSFRKDSFLIGEDFFEALEKQLHIEYKSYRSSNCDQQIWRSNDFIVMRYLNFCLSLSRCENSERPYLKGYIESEYDFILRRVEFQMKKNYNVGYRFRGIVNQEEQQYWGDLEVKPEDIAALAISSKKQEDYLLINFPNRPRMRD